MKFNHLNIPTHWRNYWTRYPEGHTILEALISWVSQVDSMVDNQNKLNDNVEQFRNEIDAFVERFDERLQSEVTQTLSDWQNSGFLDVVISEALQWQLDDYIAINEQDKLSLTAQLQKKVSETDYVTVKPTNTKMEIQDIIKLNRNVKFLVGRYSFSGIQIPGNTKIEFDGNVLITSDNLSEYVFKVMGSYVDIHGNHTKIDLNNATSIYGFNLIATPATPIQNINIKGFEIYNHPSFVTAHRAVVYLAYANNIKISDVYVHDYGTTAAQDTATTLVYAFYSEYSENIVFENVRTKNVCIAYCTTGSKNVTVKDFSFSAIANDIYILNDNSDFIIENGVITGGSQGVTVYGDNIKLSRLTISNASLGGIFLRQATNVLISQCIFKGNYYSILDQKETESKYVKIVDCIFENVTSLSVVYIQSANEWDLVNCTFNNLKSNMNSIYLYGVNANKLQRIHIKDCIFNGTDADISTTTTTGINLRIADVNAIVNCRFVNNQFNNLARAVNMYRTNSATGGITNYFLYNSYINCTYQLNAIASGNYVVEYDTTGV